MTKQLTFDKIEGSNVLASDIRGYFSTGCTTLDLAMGGGYAFGRAYEMYGKYATGKSLLALEATKRAIEAGHAVLYMDSEHTLSPDLTIGLGFTLKPIKEKGKEGRALFYNDTLIWCRAPRTVEKACDYIRQFLMTKEVQDGTPLLIIWDTLAACSTEVEIEQEFDKVGYPKTALVLSRGLPKIIGLLAETNASLVILNHIRQKIGSPYVAFTKPGGHAVEHHVTGIVFLRSLGASGELEANGKVIGHITRATVEKLKVAKAGREVDIPIYNDPKVATLTNGKIPRMGVNDDYAIFYALKDYGGVSIKGGWYTLPLKSGDVKFQKSGWPKVLDEHRDEVMGILRSCL